MITFDSFSFRYPKQSGQLFEDISLEIPSGIIAGILGPNGSGKTTLFHLLTHPGYRPYEGKITIDSAPEDRALLLQHAWLTHLLSPNELVSLFLELNSLKGSPALFMEGLSRRGKEKFKKIRSRRYGKLSTGERAWFNLELALALKTDLILLDEPTNGLDPEARMLVWEALEGQRARGKTILISSHLLDELIQRSDRFYLLRHRKLEAYANPEAFLAQWGGSSFDEAYLRAMDSVDPH